MPGSDTLDGKAMCSSTPISLPYAAPAGGHGYTQRTTLHLEVQLGLKSEVYFDLHQLVSIDCVMECVM